MMIDDGGDDDDDGDGEWCDEQVMAQAIGGDDG